MPLHQLLHLLYILFWFYLVMKFWQWQEQDLSCQSDLHSSYHFRHFCGSLPCSSPLAFVEWYSPLANTAHTHHGMMYFVKRVKNLQGNRVQDAIIPLANIQQGCMLFPTIFGGTPDTTWLHNHLTLHPPFWSIIGLVNIHIGQFINLLYMYIYNNNRYYGIYGILSSGHMRDTWETPKDYQSLPNHHDMSWAVLGLMWELWHCCVYPSLARIEQQV